MGMSVGALAENETLEKGGLTEGSIEVSYDVQESWTITIPANVELNESPVTRELAATNVMIAKGSKLEITATSEAAQEKQWFVKSNEEASIEYSIKTNNGGIDGEPTDVAKDAAVLSTDKDATATLTFTKIGTPTSSGEYKDNITFTAAVKPGAGA